MANRNATSAFKTEIVKDQTHPLHLVEVYLDSATYYLTDNFNNVTFDSNEYSALGFFLNFDTIEETASISAAKITLGLSGVDQQYTNLLLTENYVDRRVVIRKAFISSANALIPDPVIIFDGRMDNPVITEDTDTGLASIGVTVSNQFVDFEKTPGRYTNHENQQLHYPGDNGFIYASQIIKDIVWGSEFNAGDRVSGAGSLTGEITGASYNSTGDIGDWSPLDTPIWGNPISVNPGGGLGNRVFLNIPGHGYLTGATVKIDGAEGVANVPATEINGEQTITVENENKFYFDIDTTINELKGFGGGRNITIYDEPPVTAGIQTQTTTNKEHYVEILDPVLELEVGDFVQINNSGDIGGITESELTGKKFEVKEVVQNGANTAKVAVVKDEKTTAPPISTDTTVANTITLNVNCHGYNVGDTVTIAGSTDVGGVPASSINKTQTIASIKNNDSVNITVTDTVSSTVNYGGGDSVTVDGEKPNTPFVQTTSGSTTVTLHHTAHGLATGDVVYIYGIQKSVGGISAHILNTEHTVASAPDANTFTITVSTAATSTELGGGGYTFIRLPVKATSAARGGTLETTISLNIALPDLSGIRLPVL
tara:strand:- start:922 stop:2715 length:1794 start_codon:yes stop_codon:yes gene_type:complete